MRRGPTASLLARTAGPRRLLDIAVSGGLCPRTFFDTATWKTTGPVLVSRCLAGRDARRDARARTRTIHGAGKVLITPRRLNARLSSVRSRCFRRSHFWPFLLRAQQRAAPRAATRWQPRIGSIGGVRGRSSARFSFSQPRRQARARHVLLPRKPPPPPPPPALLPTTRPLNVSLIKCTPFHLHTTPS